MNEQNEKSMSVTDWLVTLIVTAIPLVGFIMLFVWAFGGNSPAAKTNWAKAALILYAIGVVLAIMFYGTVLGLLVASGEF